MSYIAPSARDTLMFVAVLSKVFSFCVNSWPPDPKLQINVWYILWAPKQFSGILRICVEITWINIISCPITFCLQTFLVLLLPRRLNHMFAYMCHPYLRGYLSALAKVSHVPCRIRIRPHQPSSRSWRSTFTVVAKGPQSPKRTCQHHAHIFRCHGQNRPPRPLQIMHGIGMSSFGLGPNIPNYHLIVERWGPISP